MTATAAPRRVLIAEDETIIRLDLRGLLEKNGFDVCGEARDGVEAVELAASLEPDVIVMDVKMPRLDGIEAAKRILEKRPVPIVMLTAFGRRSSSPAPSTSASSAISRSPSVSKTSFRRWSPPRRGTPSSQR